MAATTEIGLIEGEKEKGKHIPSQPVAIDIGGSFTKMVYFRPPNPPELPSYVHKESELLGSSLPVIADESLTLCVDEEGNTLRFLKFPSNKVVDFIKFILSEGLQSRYGRKLDHVNATGGGSYKYAAVVKESLGMEFVPQDEMASLIRGLIFVVKASATEIFNYDIDSRLPCQLPPHQQQHINYPFMLVNIGSGVSILRIDSEDHFERISGSSIGGGTFWGLCKQITGIESYQEILRLSEIGHNSGVDLLVGDIYGGSYSTHGLSAEIIASSFAKCGLTPGEEDDEHPTVVSPATRHPAKPEDVVRSLMYMVANNITQIAYLNARLHSLKQIFFTGGFVQENKVLWERITFGLRFWSKGEMQANFLRHDGYLGALGALIAPLEKDVTK